MISTKHILWEAKLLIYRARIFPNTLYEESDRDAQPGRSDVSLVDLLGLLMDIKEWQGRGKAERINFKHLFEPSKKGF